MNAPSINDTARRRYLREMGVVAYFPRRRLPGAAPSRRYGVDEPPPAGPEGLRDTLQPPETLASSPPEPAPPAPPGRNTGKEQVPEAAGVQRAVDPEPALACRGTWYRPDEHLCLIAAHSSARLPTALQQMLQRLLSALNPRYREANLQGTVVQWPLDPSMPADVHGARQMVGAFLRRRFTDSVPPFMLILMDESPVWLFPPDAAELSGKVLEPFSHPLWQQTVLRVPSLEAMAGDSSLKKPAWEALQSLIGPLAQQRGG